MASSRKKPAKKTATKKTVTKKRVRSGSGGRKSFANLSWKKLSPLIIIVALLGGYLGYKILAAPTAWTPNHSAVTPSSDVMPVIKEEGISYWFFDIPMLPALASGKTETLPAYSEIGNLVLNDKSQGAGTYCADFQSFGRPTRVKFSGANVMLPSAEAKAGYFAVSARARKDICVTADLSVGPLKITVERDNVRNKPETHALIHKLFKKSAPKPPEQPEEPPTISVQRPTVENTGPRVANPKRISQRVYVNEGEKVEFVDTIIDSLFVYGGGQAVVKNSKIEGTVVVVPTLGKQKTKVHISDSSILGGITVNVTDSRGNLYWGSEVPVDIVVSDTYIYYRQGNFANGDHTEAVAGFGWPQGARFERSTFVQQGPNNRTATATMNWHGTDTVFDTIWFDWADGIAAYYTVYVEGRNNVVKNSFLASTGTSSGYVYPSSSPHATYTNNRDLHTKELLKLPK